MVMRPAHRVRARSAEAIAAAALTLVVAAGAVAYLPLAGTPSAVATVKSDVALPGGGRPRSPGPTNPNGPS
jgi:hypothetical protein